MRGIALMGMAVLLGACTGRDPYVAAPANTVSGAWKIERQVDRITGAPVPSAIIVIDNASNSFADRPRPASLQFTCFDGKPLIRFTFDFKVGTEGNAMLGYRFDERPGRDNAAARFLQEHRTVVIEDRAEIARFVGELADARNLLIRIRSLSSGRTTAEFKVEGAGAAIEAAFAGCPVAPRSEPRKRAAS
jgi:hypothetical protein